MNFAKLYNKTTSKNAVRRAAKVAAQVARQGEHTAALSDQQLQDEFLALESLPMEKRIVPGFSLVREASARKLGLRHFDVQLIGGALLADGKLAEMRTGEGKTLTVALAAAIQALEHRGVHVVTANSYLAKRDAALMRPVYAALGLTVGAIYSELTFTEKQAAYACDITYGVGSEFGFDYLNDHLVRDVSKKVQRGLYSAIVDEIDSVLIDEARLPLTISEPDADSSDLVTMLDAVVRELRPDEHFTLNSKEHSADLTDAGYTAVETALVAAGKLSRSQELYDVQHLNWVRRLHAAVRVYALFRKGKDYVVVDGAVVLVDQGTGRKLEARRLGDGMHEALEAREGLHVRPGTTTRATITYQSYFGLYKTLCGLTGTAMTEADEFAEIYRLDVIEVPPNKPLARTQKEDLVFLTKSEKFTAAAEEVRIRHEKGQPVLVGCASVRDAEVMSRLLAAKDVPHELLTAKHVENEARVIANAGRRGAVTVATLMAGRGTDILLGGPRPWRAEFSEQGDYDAALASWERDQDVVVSLGGLFILGTERNGLRRLDNQLAGRCGRQGNPGEVQFMLSLEDELLRVFGQSKQLALLRSVIEHSGSALGGATVSQLVQAAQGNIESAGFSARKTLMRFDTVFAEQREVVFALRNQLLEHGAKEFVTLSATAALDGWLQENMPEDSMPETWDAGALKKDLHEQLGLNLPLLGWVSREELDTEEIVKRVRAAAAERLASLTLSPEEYAKVAFDVIDEFWVEHLMALAELRENLAFKSHGGGNMVFQFHKDAFSLFAAFERAMNIGCASALFKPAVGGGSDAPVSSNRTAATPEQKVALALERSWVSRNATCPCGSGYRFRLCHGKLPA